MRIDGAYRVYDRKIKLKARPDYDNIYSTLHG